MKPSTIPTTTSANAEPICAWCFPGTPGNHTICAKHRAEMLASYSGAPEVAGTFRELERAAGRNHKLTDMVLDDCHARTGWDTAREIAIGLLAGVLILGTAVLAMLAL